MNASKEISTQQRRLKTIVLIGLGNIGSHLAGLAARLPNVGRMILVDFDEYEPKNLACQEISSGDVGRSKVRVQARRLRRINPALDVAPLRARVENIPLGRLRGDVILAGLDSRAARQYVNQAAWRLGIPWIDTAVDAANLLARVNVYIPSQDAACLECAWGNADYAALEQQYPCSPVAAGSAATNAPAALGAVAAGLSAIECGKLLAGERENLLAGRQVLVGLRHHTHYVTSFRRNLRCRFDHQTWNIERLLQPIESLTLHGLVESSCATATDAGCRVGMEGHRFVNKLVCPTCGQAKLMQPRLARRLPSRQRRCPQCAASLEAGGFDRFEWLPVPMGNGRRPDILLASLGFRPSDVVTLRGPRGERHIELGCLTRTGEIGDE